jgi:hypothetical protein
MFLMKISSRPVPLLLLMTNPKRTSTPPSRLLYLYFNVSALTAPISFDQLSSLRALIRSLIASDCTLAARAYLVLGSVSQVRSRLYQSIGALLET